MNHQLIAKTIKFNSKSCPDLVFENPLLDRKVARELAASFVKIINVTKENSNLTLRHSVLKNLRKLCQNNTENHLKINEKHLTILKKIYKKQMNNVKVKGTNHKLEMFLFRQVKNPDFFFESNETNMSPEAIQALMNLDKGIGPNQNTNICGWDSNDLKVAHILKKIWIEDSLTDSNMLDNVAIKLKMDIEKQLLEAAQNVLSNTNDNEEILTTSPMESLIEKCSRSQECFYTCCGVLNSLFIMTNYNERIRKFITNFVKKVKCSSPESYSSLYPLHLQNIVILLDIQVSELENMSCKEHYMNESLKNLKALQVESKCNFIMLLTHFPQWFDIYEKRYKNKG